MAETMNMKELFALLVRRCRAVLLTALIFAVLLGGVQAFRTSRSNSDESDVSAEEQIARSMPILHPEAAADYH